MKKKFIYLLCLLMPLSSLATSLKCECINGKESFVETQTIGGNLLSCAESSKASEGYNKEINMQETKARIEIQKGQLVLDSTSSENVDLRFAPRDSWIVDEVHDGVGNDSYSTNFSGDEWQTIESFKFENEKDSRVARGNIKLLENNAQSAKKLEYDFGVVYTYHDDGKLYGEAVCIENK